MRRYRRYRLREKIGVGGMAEVWLADAERTDGGTDEVVVKRILPHLGSDPEYRAMFLDEVRIASSLEHPNVVAVLDLGHMDETPFIALEYVDGSDMRALLRAAEVIGRPPSPGVALYVAIEVLNGLEYVHGRKDPDGKPLQLVHRDVGLSNVLVSRRGEVKLSDFGIAKAKGRLSRTEAGMIKGNMLSMAPEQIRAAPVTAATDLYAAGLMLHAMLIGHHPLDGIPVAQLFNIHAQGRLPLPSNANPAIPPELDAIVRRATALAPSARFESAGRFADVLRELAGREGIAIGPEVLAAEIGAIAAAADAEAAAVTAAGVADATRTATGSAAATKAAALGREPEAPAVPSVVRRIAPLIAEVVGDGAEHLFRTQVGVRTPPPALYDAAEEDGPSIRARVEALAFLAAQRADLLENEPTRVDPDVSLEAPTHEHAAFAEDDFADTEETHEVEHLPSGSSAPTDESTVESPPVPRAGFPEAPAADADGGIARAATIPAAALLDQADAEAPTTSIPVFTAPDSDAGEVTRPSVEALGASSSAVADEITSLSPLTPDAGAPEPSFSPSPPERDVAPSAPRAPLPPALHVTARPAATFAGHRQAISAIATAPATALLATASSDGTVILWDEAGRAPLRTLRGHIGAVTSLAATPDGRLLLSGARDGSVRLWSTETLDTVVAMRARGRWVSAVALAADGSRAVSVGDDRMLHVWNLLSEAPVRVIEEAHTDFASAVALVPNTPFALSGSYDRSLKLWDLETGVPMRTMTCTERVRSLDVDPGGAIAMAGTADGRLWLWDLATGEEIATLAGHRDAVTTVRFVDARIALSGGYDGAIRIWDVARREEMLAIERAEKEPILAVAAAPSRLYAAGGTSLLAWDVDGF